MTEEVRPPCIRGCTKPILDPGTRERVGEEPRPATVGHLCAKDANNLHDWLRELPDLVAMLDVNLERGDIFEPGRRGKISGSPALIRLDAAAMLDPRSTATRRLWKDEKPTPAEDIHFSGDVIGVIEQWADCLCDDLNLSTRPKGLVQSIELLTGPWWSNVTYRPWIDELYTEVHEIRSTLRGLNNVQDPQPLGRCECGRTIYEPETVIGEETPDKSVIECKCGHRLNYVSLARLRARKDIG